MKCNVKTNDYVFCKDLKKKLLAGVLSKIVLIHFYHLLLHDYHCTKYNCLVT